MEALESGHLAGAALDVFPTEPLPPTSPILKAKNTVLSPHVAAYSDRAVMAARQLDDLRHHILGPVGPHRAR